MEQKELIERALERGDIVVVLDAMRADIFPAALSTVEHYLGVRLPWARAVVRSMGSCTPEWLAKTFGGYYCAVYYSGNPFCSDAPLCRFGKWRGTEHFREVVPLWDDRRPRHAWIRTWRGCETVDSNRAVDLYVADGAPRPAILHLMQPHPPFIVSPEIPMNWDLSAIGGRQNADAYYSAWLRTFSPQEIYWAYFSNAMYGALAALRLCIMLADAGVRTRVHVTADHGELLGEGGEWGHPCGRDDDVLRNVPWWSVEVTKCDSQSCENI